MFIFHFEFDVIIFIMVFIDFTYFKENIFKVGISESVSSDFVFFLVSFKLLKHFCKLRIAVFGTLEIYSEIWTFNNLIWNLLTQISFKFSLQINVNLLFKLNLQFIPTPKLLFEL